MVRLECGRRAGGGKGRRPVLTRWIPLLLLLAAIPAAAQEKKEAFFFRGALYQDWLGLKSDGEDLFSRLSTRLNLALWNRPGNGWTVFLDVRNRFSAGAGVANRLLLYDARLAFDSRHHNLFGQLGVMNLYDTAGVGQLVGAMAGYKFGRFLSVGAYGGLQNDITTAKLDSTYQKFGVYFRYLGPGARQLSLSCNLLRFDGRTERPFIYSSLLLPLGRFLIVYGNGEFELGENTPAADRLSHLFVNARANLSRHADVTASYSSGRGMDYHRYLLEQSQDPSLSNSEIERFYYNKTYGLRFAVTPLAKFRLHVSRQESELQDAGIRNHTTGFGIAAGDVLHSGITVHGTYNLNRGGTSEADTYYLSASRDFGKWSVNASYANFFNGVRFAADGTPQVVRIEIPRQQTISSGLFLAFSRALAVSLDYSYLTRAESAEHQLFVRVIIRQ